MKSKFIKIMIVSFIVLILGCEKSEDRNLEIGFDELKWGVCKVLIGEYGHGSGFFIDNNTVVTAAHCLEEKVENIQLYDGTLIPVVSQMTSRVADIGILKTKYVDSVFIFKIREKPLEVGEDVFSIGCPMEQYFSYSKGHLSQIGFCWNYYLYDEDLLVMNVIAGPGSSGGIVFDSYYKAIGIIVAGEKREIMPFCYVLPIKHLMELI